MSVSTSARPTRKPYSCARWPKRPTADRLGGIKQQMAAVKDGNRKQVDEPEIDRQHRHEPQQRDDAALRHLARHLRDAQRTAELVGRRARR